MNMKEVQQATTCIKHLAVSGLSSISARIKSSGNLTGNRFEMPNVSYTQPLATRREKIKNDFIFDNRKQFMTDYNIKISTDFKDKRFSFFADPLLPYWAIRVVCHRSFAHLAACSRTKLIHEGSQKSKSATHIFFCM